MSVSTARTLRDLALSDRLPFDDDPRLEWMLITWDMAARRDSGTLLFSRFLLTGEALLVQRGHHAAELFSPADPHPAEYVHYESALGNALTVAETFTGHRHRADFHMVCRPLAVDCSALAKTLTDPFGLLEEIMEHSPAGIEVLRLVNTARAGARDTHLDPDALTNLPVPIVEMLWGG